MMHYRKIGAYLAAAAVMNFCAAAGVMAAEDTENDKGTNVVSSYEYSAVSYGTGRGGKTYHRIVTTRNGVTERDVTTVQDDDGVVTWNQDDRGRQVQGYAGGIEMKDGVMTASAVAAQTVQAGTVDAGTVSGRTIASAGGSIGGIDFAGDGKVTGVQTDETDLTSAVSVAYLQQQLAELKAENQELREEIDRLRQP